MVAPCSTMERAKTIKSIDRNIKDRQVYRGELKEQEFSYSVVTMRLDEYLVSRENTMQTEQLTNIPWLNLFSRHFTTRGGKDGVWTFASRRSLDNLVLTSKEPPKADAVVIIPIIGNKLVVTKEMRHPLGDYEWGFPAGLIDWEKETIEDAATRELKEETGLDVKQIFRITPPTFSSAGLSDECVSLAFVEAEGEISTAGQEETEDIAVYLLDIQAVKRMTHDRQLKIGGKAYPIFLMYEMLGAIVPVSP